MVLASSEVKLVLLVRRRRVKWNHGVHGRNLVVDLVHFVPGVGLPMR